jgi:hypothetical protein
MRNITIMFNLKCSPKAHVIKVWSPACGAIGRWWNLEEEEPSGRKLGHGGILLKGILGPWPLPLFASQPP